MSRIASWLVPCQVREPIESRRLARWPPTFPCGTFSVQKASPSAPRQRNRKADDLGLIRRSRYCRSNCEEKHSSSSIPAGTGNAEGGSPSWEAKRLGTESSGYIPTDPQVLQPPDFAGTNAMPPASHRFGPLVETIGQDRTTWPTRSVCSSGSFRVAARCCWLRLSDALGDIARPENTVGERCNATGRAV